MDYERIKKQANDILRNRLAECSNVEYKASADQLDRILKTICAYGNNYYDHGLQYLFIGVDELNTNEEKAIPRLPISGIPQGRIEKTKNILNSLRPFLYPNVAYELITNEIDNRAYILLVVARQTGGPFMVSEKAEKDKKIHLKAGRYVRIEADTRLAKVDEEYDLLRKFANYHFSSVSSTDATIDDLSVDLLVEYFSATSDRSISGNMNKAEMCKALGLPDKNDPTEKKVRNFGVLMFADNPEKFIPYSYVEMIIDMYGTRRKMESRLFKGPVWKQYQSVVAYINDRFLNTLTIREDGEAINRKVSNFPFTAIEELIANAIVHNNYENAKPVQVYVSEKQINIVNYNRPLPPLSISDLNERTFFSERDTENPELRDMFKQLGIIESFGTGIGEAKRSMTENGSPELYYKAFAGNENITSVVIPVNEEYLEIKDGVKPKKKLWIHDETKAIKDRITQSAYSEKTRANLMRIYEKLGSEVFGNSQVSQVLSCTEVTATSYIKRLHNDLHLITPVLGQGKGKYRFAGSCMESSQPSLNARVNPLLPDD